VYMHYAIVTASASGYSDHNVKVFWIHCGCNCDYIRLPTVFTAMSRFLEWMCMQLWLYQRSAIFLSQSLGFFIQCACNCDCIISLLFWPQRQHFWS